MTPFETLPTCPCDDCIADPSTHAVGADGELHALYCVHNSAGAVYRPAIRLWSVHSPMTAEAFAAHCSSVGALHMHLVEQDRAERRAASGAQPDGSGKPN